MRIALEDLQPEQIAVIYPGDRRYPLADRVTAVPLDALASAEAGWEKIFEHERRAIQSHG